MDKDKTNWIVHTYIYNQKSTDETAQLHEHTITLNNSGYTYIQDTTYYNSNIIKED